MVVLSGRDNLPDGNYLQPNLSRAEGRPRRGGGDVHQLGRREGDRHDGGGGDNGGRDEDDDGGVDGGGDGDGGVPDSGGLWQCGVAVLPGVVSRRWHKHYRQYNLTLILMMTIVNIIISLFFIIIIDTLINIDIIILRSKGQSIRVHSGLGSGFKCFETHKVYF